MEAEADALGADGVVGVRLEIEFKEYGNDLAEFVAVGTAVVAEEKAENGTWRNNKGLPFTSDLSGQDFWTLIQSGYLPQGLVMGTCVYHIAHQGIMSSLGNIGANTEIPQFTEALYDARELAMGRMQAEAVSMIRWKRFRAARMASLSVERMTSSAPSARASMVLLAEVVKTVTFAPSACANFTARCPRPPNPTMPTMVPGPTDQRRSGSHTVIPAHMSGATPAGSRFPGR
jgi:uncharacterized protein YbjQ (UPF0145 family)